MRDSVIFVLGLLAAAAVSCAHRGPDTCGGYSIERQEKQHFRLTLAVKATEAPQWKLDEDGNPSPASFGGTGVQQAQAQFGRIALQRCRELGFHEEPGGMPYLEWTAETSVTSVSTCADPAAHGQRSYAIRVWGDRINCGYVEPL